jgi:hypothetical protein
MQSCARLPHLLLLSISACYFVLTVYAVDHGLDHAFADDDPRVSPFIVELLSPSSTFWNENTLMLILLSICQVGVVQVLDEATSALDSITEKSIQESLQQVRRRYPLPLLARVSHTHPDKGIAAEGAV